MYKKVLVFAIICCIGIICNAQKQLIPTDIKKNELQIGDTILFRFANPGASIKPYYYGSYNADYSDLAYYLEGYMSNRYHSVKRKRDIHGGYVYHADYSNLSFETPLADIHNKELVAVAITSRNNKLSRYDYNLYHEVSLRNTAFNDTLIFRCVEYNSKTTKPSQVFVPKIERMLKNKLVGSKFYFLLSKDDAGYTTDRIVLSEFGTAMRYREYTITNCTVYYEGQYWIPKKATPHIIITYQDDNGNSFTYDDYTGSSKSKPIYTKEEVDANEIEWREIRKERGHYNFSLTKVDKPRSQNVRKGTLTKNDTYEDNIISIKWYEESMLFNFNLKNKTSNTMKVIWDEALIVNFDGFTERILHKGADLEALQKSQQPAIIPSQAQIADFFWSEKYFGGRRLIAGYGGGNNGGINEGKQMKLTLPVQVGSATYTYTFTFTLKWIWDYPELREQ